MTQTDLVQHNHQDWSFHKELPIAPLVVFRILFAATALFSCIRFWYFGWIESIYTEPVFHFSYYGFEWLPYPTDTGVYLLFLIASISAFTVLIGYKYHFSALLFFLSFTYIELLDKTTYLNHYYLVSLLAFLLIWLPAGRHFSIDTYLDPKQRRTHVPAWCVYIIRFQVGLVYCYAGLSKINSDWLLHAMPLALWLPSKSDLPVIGQLLNYRITHYVFSWCGMLFDCLIPFLLSFTPTRLFAYSIVLLFHLLTAVLFNIGLFPLIMVGNALIFFPAKTHTRILSLFSRPIKQKRKFEYTAMIKPILKYGMIAFICIQALLPWRYLLYPGHLFWTEEGYRFSWRVMLMEKSAQVEFYVVDREQGRRLRVPLAQYLTPYQIKMMAQQADMIVEFAHYIQKDYALIEQMQQPEVYVEAYATLNGRPSQQYINPKVDLTKEQDSFRHKTWIIPLENP